MAGGGAAAVNILFTFPIYKAMFRQQAYGQGLKQDGLTGWWYRYYASMLAFLNHDQFYTTLLAGVATGTTEAVVFAPCERILALLQATEYNTKFRGFVDCSFKLHAIGGWREYYRGFMAVFARNGPQTVLFFHLKPKVTALLERNTSTLKANLGEQPTILVVNFCSGAAIAAFTSTVFYPLSVVKSRMQFKLGGEFENPITVFRKLTMEQRFAGVQTNIFRAFVSWGIINASYEGFIKVLQ